MGQPAGPKYTGNTRKAEMINSGLAQLSFKGNLEIAF